MPQKLNDKELCEISAGAFKWAVLGVITAIGAFIAGVVDGYLRPYSCRK